LNGKRRKRKKKGIRCKEEINGDAQNTTGKLKKKKKAKETPARERKNERKWVEKIKLRSCCAWQPQ
jgi:hypothetical protein